jgi:hypothetical protein
MADYRLGVRLTPLKARIFDLIRTHPGISIREINAIAFDGCKSDATIKTHVCQINDALVETDVSIKGASGWGYHIVRRKVVA